MGRYLLLIFSTLLSLMLLPGPTSAAQSEKASPSEEKRIIVKGKVPEGVTIEKNTVKLKKGYKFEKISNSRVNVVSRKPQTGITGSFDCTCNGTDGGCSVITTGSSVSCAVSTCTSSCYMIVTIPGPKDPTSERLRR